MRRSILMSIFISGSLLSGCMTTGAEPERFASFDCKALSELSHNYTSSLSNMDLFNDNDSRKLEIKTNNSLGFIGQSRSDLRPYEKAREKDINSIRAASRLKGC